MLTIAKCIEKVSEAHPLACRTARLLCSAVVLLGLAESTAHAQEDPGDDQVGPDVGMDAGNSAVDRFHGEFAERVQIQVPPYHGLEPKLALTYHSNDPNGFVGWGWSIAGLSTIQRASPGHGVPTWTGSDGYLLDEVSLVPCVAGSVSPSCTMTCSARHP